MRVWQRTGAKLWRQCTFCGKHISEGRLVWNSMVNENELVLNLVSGSWRNVLIRHAKIAMLLVKYTCGLYFSHSIKQPGNSQYLRSLLNVNYTEHGKPYRLHCNGSAKLTMVSQWQQRGMVEMVEDIEKSECPVVMTGIGPCGLLLSYERANQQSLNGKIG